MSGAPGLCLGSFLYRIYASQLFDVIVSHLPDARAYTDDTQSFNPNIITDDHTTIKSSINDLRSLMINDKVMFNNSKTVANI